MERWHGRMISAQLLLLVLLCACAQQQTPSATVASSSPGPVNYVPPVPSPIIGKPYPGKGVVKLINRKEGWIEINHEEIVGLMPAMEMEWFVEKSSLLNNIKVGDKVNFTVVETGKGEIITELKKAEQ